MLHVYVLEGDVRDACVRVSRVVVTWAIMLCAPNYARDPCWSCVCWRRMFVVVSL